jgi:hypothetical protein
MKYTSSPFSSDVSPLQSQISSTYTALQDTLYLLASDILIAGANATSISSLTVDAVIYCPIYSSNGQINQNPTTEQYIDCMAGSPPIVSVGGVYASFSNNSFLNIQGTIYPALNQSIPNYLQALSAAAQADLGIWFGNSLFANATMINNTISSADAVTSALQANPGLQIYYGNYGADSQPVSGAQILRTTNYTQDEEAEQWAIGVPIPEKKQTASYISTTYNCQVPKLKGALSFIICAYL